MNDVRKTKHCLDCIDATATFAKSTLNKLGVVQSRLLAIGEEDAAAEIDLLIDQQNEVWTALCRIHKDITSELKAATA